MQSTESIQQRLQNDDPTRATFRPTFTMSGGRFESSVPSPGLVPKTKINFDNGIYKVSLPNVAYTFNFEVTVHEGRRYIFPADESSKQYPSRAILSARSVLQQGHVASYKQAYAALESKLEADMLEQ